MKTGVIENHGTIFAGSKDEFISYVAEQILTDCQKKKSEFKGIDFSSIYYEVSDKTNIQEAYDDASAWYGIVALPNYFEAYANRQFAADYYGGGSFGVCDIYTDDMDIESVKKDVTKMLKEALDNSSCTIVWENAI